MSRQIYHVPYARCTDLEPQPGWYVGPETSRDIEGDGPNGPFQTSECAREWLDEQREYQMSRHPLGIASCWNSGGARNKREGQS